MEPKKIVSAALLIAYGALIFALYSTNIFPEQSTLILQDIAYLAAPLFAFVAGIYALRKYGTKSIHGKSLLFIVFGFAVWFIAESIWAYYEIFLGEKPSPSVADIFYLLAYPFILYGILNELKLGKIIWTRKKKLVNIGIMLVLWSVTIYYGIYSAYDPEVTLIENIASIAYGVADMIIVTAVILLMNLVAEFRGGAFSDSWRIFGIGMLFNWIADMFYAMFYNQYIAGEFIYRQIDYLWLANYLLVGYALLMQGAVLDEMMARIVPKKKR